MLKYSDITTDQQELITALYEGHCLAIAPIGYGKAVCGQTAIQELIEDSIIKRAIIFAPLKVCELTWKNEWRKWDHLHPVVMATGTPAKRRLAIESTAPIVVMNFDNLAWFFKSYPDGHDFNGILFDELSKLKSPGSKMVKKARHALKHFVWRAGMSATPVAESGADIYAQALMVDGGEALGTRQDRFRMNYCMQLDYKGYKWGLQPGAAARVAAALKDIMFIADSEAYEASLPELRDTQQIVAMPDRGWEFYQDMASDLIIQIEGTEVEAANMGVMTGKLQQIVQGFMYCQVGGVRRVVVLHTAKFNALHDILKDQRPTIVAYQFQWELEMLRGEYPEMMFLADNAAEAERAWNAGELRLLGVHPQSAGHGLNLQMCPGGNRLVCLAPTWSADLWRQMLGRIRRRGQRAQFVERITLVTPNTVDELVLDRLAGKRIAEYDFMTHLKGASG